jgi:hypothetical protein
MSMLRPRLLLSLFALAAMPAAADAAGPRSAAPDLARTLVRRGVLLRQYDGTGRYSLDNYLAMISGQAATPETRDDRELFADFVATGVVNFERLPRDRVAARSSTTPSASPPTTARSRSQRSRTPCSA